MFLASAALLPSTDRVARAQTDSRPNILIILTDDQRTPGTLGVMPEVTGRFVNAGTEFTQGFATTPLCCPSRANLMTGQYAHNTGVRHNGDATKLPQDRTLQKYLHDNGYWTGILGKYLNRWDINKAPPHFDRYAIFTPDPGYYDVTYNSNGDKITPNAYSTDYLSTRVGTFLDGAENRDSQPWFLMVTPYAPHYPQTPEPSYASSSVPTFFANPAVNETDRSDKPQYVQDRFVPLSTLKTTRANQLRTLMSVDDLVTNAYAQMNARGRGGAAPSCSSSPTTGSCGGNTGSPGSPNRTRTRSRSPSTCGDPPGASPAGRRTRGSWRSSTSCRRCSSSRGSRRTPTSPSTAGRSWEASLGTGSCWSTGRRGRRPARSGPRPGRRSGPPTYQYVEYYAADRHQIIYREYYNLVTDPWQNLNLLGDASTSNDPDIDRGRGAARPRPRMRRQRPATRPVPIPSGIRRRRSRP